MFRPIFLPRILHYIFLLFCIYLVCLRALLFASIKNSGLRSGRLCALYCNMTNKDLMFTRDFNMPARVRVHVNVT